MLGPPCRPGPSPPPPPPRRTGLPLATTLAYGAGNFAFALLGLVVAVNLQFFYTDYVGLSAGLVSWSLLFARVFDSFVDPVMAYVSDRTRARLGRRRPYILGAALPLGVAFYYLFTPPGVRRSGGAPGAAAALHGRALHDDVRDLDDRRDPLLQPRRRADRRLPRAHARDRGARGLLPRRACWWRRSCPAYLIDVYGGRAGYSFMGAILGPRHRRSRSSSRAPSWASAPSSARSRRRSAPTPAGSRRCANPHFRRLLLAFVLSAIAGAVPATLVIYVSVYVIGTPDWWARVDPRLAADLVVLPARLLPGGRALAAALERRARAASASARPGASRSCSRPLTSAGCWWLAEGSIGSSR